MAGKSKPQVLIIDDEQLICKNCVKILASLECEAEYVLNGFDALQALEDKKIDIIITDLKMGAIGGLEVLKRVNAAFPYILVIVITGFASVSSAVEVMKSGAFDYLPKPFTPDELRAVTQKALDELVRKKSIKQTDPSISSHQLIGSSPEINKVIEMLRKVAPTDSTVLVNGESGTGKELVARAVHANSKRSGRVFFAIDCGNLAGNLLESELFGFKKGAFTGAERDKDGIFSLAHKGTIFLDEISNISLDVQGKLLRFLETREFLPIGSSKMVKVDVRLIFATNKDLKKMVGQGTFREDFYYRIFVYPITLPPLRFHKRDIMPIAYHFLNGFRHTMGKKIVGFDEEAVIQLVEFDWPGNVRQLRNIIERAVILCENDIITLNELPVLGRVTDLEKLIKNIPTSNDELKIVKKEIRKKAVMNVEKKFVINALSKSRWNITYAAKLVGMQRTNFQNMVKKYGISFPGQTRKDDD